MKCEICNKNTDINWSGSEHILCEVHSVCSENNEKSEHTVGYLKRPHAIRENTKGLNITFLIIYMSALIPWFILSCFSPMAFDSPGSDKQIFPYIFVGFIVSYPLWAGIFCVLAHIYYVKGKYGKSMLFSVMPIIFGVSVSACIYIFMTVSQAQQ